MTGHLMISHRLMLSTIGCVAGMSLSAGAQGNVAPSAPRTLADTASFTGSGGCPGGNGIRISVTSGGTTSGAPTPGDTVSKGIDAIIDQRRSIDTTWVFNVSQKSWTRTNLAAALSVGLSGGSRGSYSICAGVTALMPSATLTIRGARGRVHFAASLQELMNAIRPGTGVIGPQPRRL